MSEGLDSGQLDVVNAIAQTLSWSIGLQDETRQLVALLGCKQLMKRHALDHNDLTETLYGELGAADNMSTALTLCLKLLPDNYQRLPHLYSSDSASLVSFEASDAVAQTKAVTESVQSVDASVDSREVTVDENLDSSEVVQADSTKSVDTSVTKKAPNSIQKRTEKEHRKDVSRFRKQLRKECRDDAKGAKSEVSSNKVVRREFWHIFGAGSPVGILKGTSPKISEALGTAGINLISELLLTPPKGFERTKLITKVEDMVEGRCMLRGTITSFWIRFGEAFTQWELSLDIGQEKTLQCIWPTAPRGWENWKVNQSIAVVGALQIDDDYRMADPEPVGLDGRGTGVFPTYSIEGVDDREMRDLMAMALNRILNRTQDHLPKEVIERNGLLSFDEALREAHFPSNTANKGRRRLCFDEAFLYQIAQRLNHAKKDQFSGISHTLLHEAISKLGFIKNIHLNDAQELAFSEIRRDLILNRPMNRLLQGDVGSGKTLISLMTAIMVAQSGKQVVYVAPDNLTAERRFLFADELMRVLGIPALLVQGFPDRARMDALRRGEATVIFGSLDLLSSDITWKSLGLVILEETSNFGEFINLVQQRPSPRPDLLVITPTPQPMRILETVYTSLDVSIIPSSTRPLPQTLIADASQRAKVYEDVRAEIALGRQAYVVLPVKNGSDLLSLEEALRMASVLGQELLKGARIGVYCSEMKREERIRVFDDFVKRRIDVLFCTTYIEDAPSLGNANAIIVEYADKHEILRLHRLRSQVSRAHFQPICRFVLSDNALEKGVERVKLAAAEQNGFLLAEADEKMKEESDSEVNTPVVASPQYIWIDDHTTRELRLSAREAARQLLMRDLLSHRWPMLINAVQKWWSDLVIQLPKPPSKTNRRRKRRRRK